MALGIFKIDWHIFFVDLSLISMDLAVILPRILSQYLIMTKILDYFAITEDLTFYYIFIAALK